MPVDNWNRTEYAYEKQDFGKWTLTLPPNADGTPKIKHLSEIKVKIVTISLVWFDYRQLFTKIWFCRLL